MAAPSEASSQSYGDVVQELQALLSQLLSATPHLKIVITSCHPGAALFSGYPHVELRPMPAQDAQHLLQGYCPDLTPNDSQDICSNVCQLNPLVISLVGACLASSKIDAQARSQKCHLRNPFEGVPSNCCGTAIAYKSSSAMVWILK